MTLKDLIANTISYNNIDEYLNEQISQETVKELFYAIFSLLTRTEVRIFEMFYGLNGYEPQTLKAISQDLWFSPSTASQHKQKALKMLQQPEVLKLLKQIYQGEDINIKRELEKIAINFHPERLKCLWNRELGRKLYYIKKNPKLYHIKFEQGAIKNDR